MAARATPRRRSRAAVGTDAAQQRLLDWFTGQGWQAFAFQREVWRRWRNGESGLLHTPTGSGKTLAAFGGPLIDALENGTSAPRRLQLIWVTPLRALAADTVRALREPIAALGLDWQVVQRTGDASARDKRLARTGRADVLVTTPESLALLLSYADTAQQLGELRGVVVDEWHELLGNKRGVLLQLCLARLRRLAPALRTWGLSATLGNLDEARAVLLPRAPDSALVGGVTPRALTLETLLPTTHERFAWAGHLGLAQLARVMQRLFAVPTSLLFTNTRRQAEIWHAALASVWPEAPGTLALHHGSLAPALRQAAEQGLRERRLRCVVATSSLDLGVDFPAVDQVLQLGSPKGLARLLQRAGRARHWPGAAATLTCIPTHALELLEYAAARQALARGRVEARPPPRLSLDVLAQHCVTLALGGGFDAAALFDEVRETHAYAELTRDDWQAVLDFIVRGGSALESYPDFRRVLRGGDGIYRVEDRRIAYRHRLGIGTITSDGMVAVKFLRGATLGAVEEAFIGQLHRGDVFQFAGRSLSLVRLEDMTAYVRAARSRDGASPTWRGGRLPLSNALGREVQALFVRGDDSPEWQALRPLLRLQQTLSALPGPQHLLVENLRSRRGQHLCLYPFAGRLVHDGLAAVLALRLARSAPNSFAYATNDYGLMLTGANPFAINAAMISELLHPAGLEADLAAALNLTELARRQFRDIARIAGLLPPSLPGRAPRSLRQLQASSGMIYDVLRRYDPDHVLLALAEREVRSHQLDLNGLAATLADCSARPLTLREPASLTPLSFPLWAESFRGHLSNEDWNTRIARAAAALEKKHG